MANWNGLILTNKGRNLQAKVEAGQTLLELTKMKLGDGIISGGQSLEELIDLVSPKKIVGITSKQALEGGLCKITGTIINTDVTEGYYLRELGLFATDPDDGEILYAITTDSSPDYLPANGTATAVSKTFSLNIAISNTEQVTVVLDLDGLVTVGDLNAAIQEHNNDPNAHGGIFKKGYLSEFKNFYEQSPPTGWAVRNGAVLANADTSYSELWQELQKTENAWKLKEEADWQTMSTTAGGIGGVPFFVLDTTAKTIRLPDTRGDYIRDAGGSNMPDVGEWREGTIITGVVPPEETDANNTMLKGIRYGEDTGLAAFTSNGISATSTYYTMYYNRMRPRSFTTLPCVYVGGV